MAYRTVLPLCHFDRQRAHDIANTAMMKLLRHEAAGKPCPLNPEAFACRVARNAFTDEARAQQRRRRRERPLTDEGEIDEGYGTIAAGEAERSGELAAYLDVIRRLLPPRWWTLWKLNFDGYSAVEIASMVSPPLAHGTVRNILSKANQLLRQHLPPEWFRLEGDR